jgi:hypothetical protein
VNIPERVWSQSSPNLEVLRKLLAEAEQAGVSKPSLALLKHRAALAPWDRIVCNIGAFLAICSARDVRDILADGLTSEERHALCELDSCGLSIPLREAAHGLFGIHERWLVLKALSRSLREAAANWDAKVVERPLDRIVQDNHR